jgi:hypothetical protein
VVATNGILGKARGYLRRLSFPSVTDSAMTPTRSGSSRCPRPPRRSDALPKGIDACLDQHRLASAGVERVEGPSNRSPGYEHDFGRNRVGDSVLVERPCRLVEARSRSRGSLTACGFMERPKFTRFTHPPGGSRFGSNRTLDTSDANWEKEGADSEEARNALCEKNGEVKFSSGKFCPADLFAIQILPRVWARAGSIESRSRSAMEIGVQLRAVSRRGIEGKGDAGERSSI